MTVPGPQDPSDGDTQRVNAIVLVVVLMAVGLLFWLVAHIHNNVLYENCHMAGFRNCVSDRPIIAPSHKRDRLE